eukprot:Opistho-1_new@38190
MYTACFAFVSSITMLLLPSWYSIAHRLPSSSSRRGGIFLAAAAAGADVFGLPSSSFAFTTDDARRAGFLCVISLLSTFLRPDVTPSPLLSALNTSERPPPPALGADAAGDAASAAARSASAEGAPAGGGGGPPAAGALAAGADAETVDASTPFLFQATPVVWNFFTYAESSLSVSPKARTSSTCFLSVSLKSLMTRFAQNCDALYISSTKGTGLGVTVTHPRAGTPSAIVASWWGCVVLRAFSRNSCTAPMCVDVSFSRPWRTAGAGSFALEAISRNTRCAANAFCTESACVLTSPPISLARSPCTLR